MMTRSGTFSILASPGFLITSAFTFAHLPHERSRASLRFDGRPSRNGFLLADLQDPRRLLPHVFRKLRKFHRQSGLRTFELQWRSCAEQIDGLRRTHVFDYKAVARPVGQ